MVVVLGDFFQVFLTEGRVVARLKQDKDILMSVYTPQDFKSAICDGNWHKIKGMVIGFTTFIFII